MATREVKEEGSMQYKNNSNLLVPALVLVLAGLAFAVGALWQRVEYLQKGSVANVATAPGNPAQPQQPPADPTVSVKADTLKLDPVSDGDHIKGDKKAQLTLIEYSDLQCPFCQRFHPTLLQVMKDYDGKVKWVYRHFPLESIHPVALKAAVGSECVAQLGGDTAFWKYVDAAFAGESSTLTLAKLPEFAATAGVNKSAFQTCLDGDKTLQAVRDSQASGTKVGVQGTPATYILDGRGNAWILGGALPFESVKQIIDKALQG